MPAAPTTFRFVAAPFTPKGPDGAVLYERIPEMVHFLQTQGLHGVFINGTTGEGLSLSVPERRKLAEVWCEASRGQLKLIVHIGHTCLTEARELAAHAEVLKADAIAAIGPCFFGVDDPAVLAEYNTSIAAGAPQTPFYYYHMPSMARVTCKASEALPLLVEKIPTFAGIKFTHDDLQDYHRCLEISGGRFEIFFGRDEMLLSALKQGAEAAVGSTYNFATPLYRRMVEAFRAGDLPKAEVRQNLATEGIRVMMQAGGMPAVQATMALAGFDNGAMRLPLRSLTAEQREALRQALEKLHYFEQIQNR